MTTITLKAPSALAPGSQILGGVSSYTVDANGFVNSVDSRDVGPLLAAGFLFNGLTIASQAIGASGLVPTSLPLLNARNITGAALGAAAAANVFGYTITLATFAGLVSEAANSNAKADAALLEYVLPPNYVAGQNITVTINTTITIGGGTLSVKTIGLNAYKAANAGTQGADICATTPITIPSNAATDNVFTITGTGLVPGDKLYLKPTLSLTETGASAVTATINSIRVS